MARYWRIDSGMASQSSPVSILFLAKSFILARLSLVSTDAVREHLLHLPILKPDLNRPFGHVDVLRYPLSNYRCGGGVLAELFL